MHPGVDPAPDVGSLGTRVLSAGWHGALGDEGGVGCGESRAADSSASTSIKCCWTCDRRSTDVHALVVWRRTVVGGVFIHGLTKEGGLRH